MPSSLTCPDDAELLAVAAGEEPSAELREHLADCSSCRSRLERFRAELALLREAARCARLPRPQASRYPILPRPTARRTTRTPPRPASGGIIGNEDLGIRDRPRILVRAGGAGEADLPAAIGKYLVIGRFPPTGQAEVFRVVHPGLAKDLVLKLSLSRSGPTAGARSSRKGRSWPSWTIPTWSGCMTTISMTTGLTS